MLLQLRTLNDVCCKTMRVRLGGMQALAVLSFVTISCGAWSTAEAAFATETQAAILEQAPEYGNPLRVSSLTV